jgi:hypothetical protein
MRRGQPPDITSSSTSAERRRAASFLLIAIVTFAVLATPFFLGRVYVADDLGQFHLPIRDFYARQLARGEPFDWMPGLYGGFQVAAEGQLGAYHPWHWALYRFLPLGAAFDVELLASYPFLFAGTYLLLRRLAGRRDAALLGALAFTFGGFNLLHFVHPNAIAVVAHLPWLLWAIDVALVEGDPRRRAAAVLGVGLLTASQLLLGYPQYVWFSLVAEVALVGWRVSAEKATLGRVASLGSAVAAGGLIGAVQWLPTWRLLEDSTRQTADAAFTNAGSLHPLNLVQLVAPYLFQTRVVGQNTHELGLYIGAVPIVLCAWLFARRSRWGKFRPLVIALALFAIFALVLAAGEFGGLYRLQRWLPVVGQFRFPCRAIVLVQLAAAGLTAVAAAILFERRLEENGNRSEVGYRPLWIVVAASVALAVAGPLAWPEFVARPILVWSGPLLIAAAAGWIALAERGTRGAALMLAVLTAVDLGVYGMSYSVLGRTTELRDYVASIQRPPGAANARVAAIDEPHGPRVGDRMLLAGLERADGYAGLEPKKRLDYRQPRSLQLAGVAWVLRTNPLDPSQSEWVANASFAPRARLLARVNETLTADEGPPNWQTGSAEPHVVLPRSTPGLARAVIDRPGEITIVTDSPARQVLATTESFDSGWSVAVDERPGEIVRVDGDFLGCVVEAGKHRVTFEFRPRYRDRGVLLSACGLGLLMLTVCVPLVRARRRAV